MDNKSKRKLVFLDAENTLYDTASVIAGLQLDMLARAEQATGLTGPQTGRLSWARGVDHELARRDRRGADYPPAYLFEALRYRLDGNSAAQSAVLALEDPETELDRDGHGAWFSDKLETTLPKLRHGVAEGLESLKKSGAQLVVLTESPQARCEHFLERHGLLGHIDGGVIECRKDPQLYRDLRRQFTAGETAIMVGDQPDRDIGFARKAGFTTVHFPNSLRPAWLHEQDGARADHIISSLVELPAIYSGPDAANQNRVLQTTPPRPRTSRGM